MIKLKKYLPLLIIISLSITILAFDLHQYFSFENLKTHQYSLDVFIRQHLLWAIIIYSSIYIAVVSLSIPGALFMTITSGFLFGQWIGTVSAVLSATIGATLLFLSAKLASTDLIAKKTGRWTKTIQKGIQEDSFSYLLTLRLIPLVPFVALNLAAALFQVSLRVFCLSTLIGIIPGSFVYTSVGVALREVIQEPDFSPEIILDPKIIIALIGLGGLSIIPVIYKYLRKRFKRNQSKHYKRAQ